MNTRNLLSITVIIVLAGVYVFFFTDWFKSKRIEIFHTSRAIPNARFGPRVRAGNANTAIIQFGMDNAYRLTEIKVVSMDELKTNPTALPVWHLISDSNSVPTKGFPYGVAVGGMKPAVGNEWPRPLEPNASYRIFVAAGPRVGQHDFITMAKSEREIQAESQTVTNRPGPRRIRANTNTNR